MQSLWKSGVLFHVSSILLLDAFCLVVLDATISLIHDFLFEETFPFENSLSTYGWLCPTLKRLGGQTSIAEIKLGHSN